MSLVKDNSTDVIPAKAGIQRLILISRLTLLDSRLRGNDEILVVRIKLGVDKANRPLDKSR